MDDPNRIAKSKAAGALFGLTPKKYQSGEKDVTGGITRTGDEMARTALYEAANVLLARITRFSKLKRWGMVDREVASGFFYFFSSGPRQPPRVGDDRC
jgi:transposase